MQLKLTRQALADLGLSVEEYCGRWADEFQNLHPVVAAFVERRQQNPEGIETTQLPVTRAVVYNLHNDRWRGLTWHDRESDVVWLLGVGWHEQGSRTDAYEVLKRRDVLGELMPTEDDYRDLEMPLEELESFVTHVWEEVPELLLKAQNNPGLDAWDLIAGRLEVGIYWDKIAVDDQHLNEVWIAFKLPPRDGPCHLPPQAEWLTVILGVIVPHNQSQNVDIGASPFPTAAGQGSNVITVRWSVSEN